MMDTVQASPMLTAHRVEAFTLDRSGPGWMMVVFLSDVEVGYHMP